MLREQGDLEAVFQRRNLTFAPSPPHPDPLAAAAAAAAAVQLRPSHDGLNRSASAPHPEKASVPASISNSSASSCFASSASNTSTPASDDCSPDAATDAATASTASFPAPPVKKASAEAMQVSERASEQDRGSGEAVREDDVRDEMEASDTGDGLQEGRRRRSGHQQGGSGKRRRQGDSGDGVSTV